MDARVPLAALLLALGAGLASAQDLAQGRARWEQKSEAEREVLRQRFAQLSELAPEERRALEQRAEKLKRREQAVQESLPEEERARLADLSTEERDGVLQEHLRGVLRREGEDARARMPAKLVETLEAEKPLKRPLRLDQILKPERPLGLREVRRIGEALGAPPEELRGLEALDGAGLEDRVLRWQRAAIDRAVEQLGPPPGLDRQGYEALRGASHQEFFRRWRALDPPEAYGAGPGHAPERAPAARPGSPPVRERVQQLMRLRQLAEPTLEERVAAARLPEAEREAALAGRIEERVLAFAAEHDLFTREELAELRAASGTAFPDAARRLASAKERHLRASAKRGAADAPAERGASAPRGGR